MARGSLAAQGPGTPAAQAKAAGLADCGRGQSSRPLRPEQRDCRRTALQLSAGPSRVAGGRQCGHAERQRPRRICVETPLRGGPCLSHADGPRRAPAGRIARRKPEARQSRPPAGRPQLSKREAEEKRAPSACRGARVQEGKGRDARSASAVRWRPAKSGCAASGASFPHRGRGPAPLACRRLQGVN